MHRFSCSSIYPSTCLVSWFAHSRHQHSHEVFINGQVWHKHQMYHTEFPTDCCQQKLLSMLLTGAQLQDFALQFFICWAETVQTQIGYYCCYHHFYCYHQYCDYCTCQCYCHHHCKYYHYYLYYGSSNSLDVFARSAVEGLAAVLNVLLVLCQMSVQAHTLVLASNFGCRLHEVLCDVERGARR